MLVHILLFGVVAGETFSWMQCNITRTSDIPFLPYIHLADFAVPAAKLSLFGSCSIQHIVFFMSSCNWLCRSCLGALGVVVFIRISCQCCWWLVNCPLFCYFQQEFLVPHFAVLFSEYGIVQQVLIWSLSTSHIFIKLLSKAFSFWTHWCQSTVVLLEKVHTL